MNIDLWKAIHSLRTGYMLTDENGSIQFVNQKGLDLLQLERKQVSSQLISSIIPSIKVDHLSTEHFFNEIYYANRKFFFNYSPIYCKEKKKVLGASFLFNEEHYYEVFLKELDAYQNLNRDLKAIFDISYDVIYVSDRHGKTLRVSSACKELWGKESEELVGKSIYDLEKLGIFKPSITRLVLEQKKTVSFMQTTLTGRRLLVVGTPIQDENGEIIRVVNASRDLTAVDQLQAELKETKQLMEGYKKELAFLRNRKHLQNEIVYQSPEMERIISFAHRVADVDSTVLILGETGVGKEVIAHYIHRTSHRAEKPFITINCGAIPENLLESELFGYEKGAFTGAVKQKSGLFELADEGTLFLDEIGEMSPVLQVKLLRVLQDRKFVRVGGTKEISINFRLITATNRDLYEEVQKGTFREDLYYRLNVIPIKIPPLRERKEDILSLIQHFLHVYNEKYVQTKTLSQAALTLLQQYEWPGNVRELQNIIERLVVLAEHDVIDQTDCHTFLYPMTQREQLDDVVVNQIIPLKQCLERAEMKLLQLAKEQYQTTTKIAQVLEVNQSTISRKLKKLKDFERNP